MVKNLLTNARCTGDMGSIPESGRCPGGGNGNPLQYYCLKNPVDRGTWWATVHGVTESQTQLSTHTLLVQCLRRIYPNAGAQVQSLVGELDPTRCN